MKLFIDANIFIYSLIDLGPCGQFSVSLLDEIARGKYTAITSALVIDEVIWALVKNQKQHLVEIYISNLYKQPHLNVASVNGDLPLRAIEFMKEYNLKPRDAMHCAFMEENEINTIASTDSVFDKVKGINRLFPIV